jgi:hypothetical protein
MDGQPSTFTIASPARPLPLDGFVLRLPAEEDVDALVRFGDDPDTAETLWVPIPSPCSRAIAQQRMRQFSDGWRERSTFDPTLVVADVGRLDLTPATIQRTIAAVVAAISGIAAVFVSAEAARCLTLA